MLAIMGTRVPTPRTHIKKPTVVAHMPITPALWDGKRQEAYLAPGSVRYPDSKE